MHELEIFTWIVDAVGSVFMSYHVPTLAKNHYYIKKKMPLSLIIHELLPLPLKNLENLCLVIHLKNQRK